MTPQALCALHPERAATSVCSRCGAFTCAECNPSTQGVCPSCQALTGADRVVKATPWERRAELGLVRGAWETWRSTMLEPGAFVRSLDPAGPAIDAFLYGWLISTIGGLVQVPFLILNFIQSKAQLAEVTEQLNGAPWLKGVTVLFEYPVAAALAVGVLTVVIYPLSVLISAGLAHIGVRVMGSTQRPFGATVRAISYALAPNLVSGVPIIGGFAGFYVLFLEVWALREAHELSTGRAIVAVLWPIVFACCFGVAGAMALGAGLASGLK